MTIDSVITEYLSVLDGITAVFLDSRNGFELLQAHIETQAGSKSWDEPIYFGDGPPATCENVAHATTIGDRIGRNACDGENCTFVSNMAVVSIYGYWEDHFRAEIAKALGKEKNQVASDIFGDIRRLRQSIVHHRGIALKDVESCKVLQWFSENDQIFLSETMYIQMLAEIHEYLRGLKAHAL